MLSLDLQFQKQQMMKAVGWLNIIEECDRNISDGNKIGYYRGVRQEAIENYATAMSNLIGQAMEISKVLLTEG